MATKFMFLYRSPQSSSPPTLSPAEAQASFAAWQAWKSKFDKEIMDIGDGLKPDGLAAVYKAGAVTDGPFIESKEILGGYSIISSSSLERALEIARECPINRMPGASIEVREFASYMK